MKIVKSTKGSMGTITTIEGARQSSSSEDPLEVAAKYVGPRLEGQTGTPHYMTEPPEPSFFARTAYGEIEVRIENGRPWMRERREHTWRGMYQEDE